MDQQAHASAAAQLTVTRGNPTPEELAAVTALLMALDSREQDTARTVQAPKRVARLRKRTALSTPRLSWNLGRR
ncbi:acyl-CoA carboxylase subunit epsilon [Glutamicibacter protophormiae]|uniref:acyl-CoA carboxylase subunit epsilon n=1 Tax=Glutamicibacter protophormiae TaxID=37930 RepID=UPI00195DD53D|nr:acyl-CoA carboxylase subunit epsilon [Glutamicibacter protophormiae]QRQ79478.1 acyl-CoA carboxylase subunit epsilon [Glutamicibacter protophormiae]